MASVFSKTSSLGIKVRGLEAFVVLCGGSNDNEQSDADDFTGVTNSAPPTRTSAILDKYTVQEKIVPLLKAIKTKEPAVMMAALAVFKQVGKIADAEFLAMETLPILWSFCLGPLLNLQQFQQFMDLIKKLSTRIEAEQIKKLRDLSSNAHQSTEMSRSNDLMNVGAVNGAFANGSSNDVGEGDFERLVLGSRPTHGGDMLGDAPAPAQPSKPASTEPPMFSWSSPHPPTTTSNSATRTITPDQNFNAFATLSPTTATGAQSNMQRTTASGLNSFAPMQPTSPSVWPSMQSQPQPQPQQASAAYSNFNALPTNSTNTFSSFALTPPPMSSGQQPFAGANSAAQFPGLGQNVGRPAVPLPKKSGLDAFESLL